MVSLTMSGCWYASSQIEEMDISQFLARVRAILKNEPPELALIIAAAKDANWKTPGWGATNVTDWTL